MTINLRLYNVGTAHAGSVTVRFTASGSQLDSSRTVVTIPAGGSLPVDRTLDTHGFRGLQDLVITADPSDEVFELKETNSTATANVTVRRD